MIGAVALIVAVAIASLAYVIASKRIATPTRELARAVRCLDRILAYDDSVTALSTDLRREAQEVTRTYYRELS